MCIGGGLAERVPGLWGRGMSVCVSKHGEYADHTPDSEYLCTRCAALDVDALRFEVRQLRALRDRLVDIAQRTKPGDAQGVRWELLGLLKRYRRIDEGP